MASAHYKAKCEGSLPIKRIKYQYFVLEDASIIKFDIRVEYVWELDAKPMQAYSFWCAILLSIEAGMPITFVCEFIEMK